MGVIEEGTLPLIARTGFFAGPYFAAFVPDEAVRFYDITRLEDGITFDGALDFTGTATPVEAAAASGSTIYAAYGEGGLAMVDRYAPDSQESLSNEPTHALLISGSTLFAAGTSLTAWDISTPAS